MKIRDILHESSTDIVARFYKEASADSDKFYNLEDVKYKDKNKEYYDEHFKQWFNEGIVSVFTTPINKSQKPFTSKPTDEVIQSPGYRGLQYALAAAGLPYNSNVQKYKPNAQAIVASAAMDACRANNGQ
jgi:hypothetical protein